LEVLDLRELPVADMPGSRRTYVYGVLRRI
jgi:hypothetical protein